MKEPIVFRCEPDLWEMLARGEKTWDARRWDLADDRIYRLAWGHRSVDNAPLQAHPYPIGVASRWGSFWSPDEPTVSFQNKATGEVLTFQYLGIEFVPWAPGWAFLLLGERVGKQQKEKG